MKLQPTESSNRFCSTLLNMLDSLYPDQRRQLERAFGLKNGTFYQA